MFVKSLRAWMASDFEVNILQLYSGQSFVLGQDDVVEADAGLKAWRCARTDQASTRQFS